MVGSLRDLVPVDHEKLVTVIELKLLGDSAGERWTNSMSSRTTSQPRCPRGSQRGGPRLGPARVDPPQPAARLGPPVAEAIPAAAIHPVGRLS